MDKKQLYEERERRFQRAIACEPVDRVPVVYMAHAFSPRYVGVPLAEYVDQPETAVSSTMAAVDKFEGFDGVNLPPCGVHPILLSTIWLSRVFWPGRELGPDALWQVHEAEVMTVDDYDVIINEGWGPFVQQFLPRILDMNDFQRHMEWVGARYPSSIQGWHDQGYVTAACAVTTIPFEYLCGGRSLAKFFMDLYRMPEKVEAAMKVMEPELIAQAKFLADFTGVRRLWLGGWRAASAMLSPRLWDRFVWPYYRRMAEAYVEAGITPVLHWDQDWTRDLERLNELPAKKCILNPDGMTDLRKFRQVVGDRMAVMGDVPASLLVAGSPEDVSAYVKGLIDDLGPVGLVICNGCDGPVNAKPENIQAVATAAHEYGVAA